MATWFGSIIHFFNLVKTRAFSGQSNSIFRSREYSLITLLGFLFSLMLLHPGSLSEDSVNQFTQAFLQKYTDNHPPLMAWMWHLWNLIVPGAFGMLFLQLTMFWLGLWFFVDSLQTSYLIKSSLSLVLGFYPAIFGIVGVIWKDNQMLGAFMLGLGLLSAYPKKRSAWTLIFAFLAFWYGGGVRHNAAAALPGLLFGFFWTIQSRMNGFFMKKFLTVSLKSISCAAVIFFTGYSFNLTLSESRSSFSMYYKVWDIIGMASFGKFDISKENLHTSIPITDEVINRIYTPRQFGPMVNKVCDQNNTNCFVAFYGLELNKQEMKELTSLWITTVLNNPLAYLQHRFSFFAHAIGLVKDPVWAAIYTGGAANEYGLKFEPSVTLKWILVQYSKLLENWVYKVWFYILVLIAGLCFGIRELIKNHSPWIFAISSSGLLYISTILLLAVSPDYRYSNWTVLCGLLVTAQFVFNVSSKSSKD